MKVDLKAMLPAKFGTGEKFILIVEDDDAAFMLLQMGLQEVGGNFRLYRVENGGQALDFLRRSGPYADAPRPNLVLLNLNMPKVSGFDVLEGMRDDPTIADVPAVVFTSSRLDTDKARCLGLGARKFLTKPTHLDEFQNVLHNICSLL